MIFLSLYLYIAIFYTSLFYFCFSDEFDQIEYPQDLTKIKYYDSSHKINKIYLYKHVGKPLLQDLVISVKVNQNEKKNVLFLPKKKTFIKIRGDWSDYPNDKNKFICIVFIDKKQLLQNVELNCPKDVFESSSAKTECYSENDYSIRNLFLYIEISQTFINKIFNEFNIPILINTDDSVLYFTNSKDATTEKEKKENLDLHLCYRSFNEISSYIGKIIFNAYPSNIQKNLDINDAIYTESFLTSKWKYSIFIKGNYITIYNRLVFIRFPRDYNMKKKCLPFWHCGILGSSALKKIHKKSDKNTPYNHVEYFFSNNIPSIIPNSIPNNLSNIPFNNYYIPYIKNDELHPNENYLICLYSDENDFEGMELRNVYLFINNVDTIVLILLFFFIIVLLPIIFSLTYLYVTTKMNILKFNMKKLQLLNRKNEIEDRLKKELCLDNYEPI